mgnify:CR=1 FL=1
MLRFVAKRLISLIISLVVASIVIFLFVEVVPGDPAAYMLGLNAQEDTLAALREQLGLNGTLLERYASWAGGMLRGDFGTSYTYRTPVSEMIGERMWISLPLAIYALTLSTLIALCESGVNPEALAAVVRELRRETNALKAKKVN